MNIKNFGTVAKKIPRLLRTGTVHFSVDPRIVVYCGKIKVNIKGVKKFPYYLGRKKLPRSN